MIIGNTYFMYYNPQENNKLYNDYRISIKNLGISMPGFMKTFAAETIEEMNAYFISAGITDPDGYLSDNPMSPTY